MSAAMYGDKDGKRTCKVVSFAPYERAIMVANGSAFTEASEKSVKNKMFLSEINLLACTMDMPPSTDQSPSWDTELSVIPSTMARDLCHRRSAWILSPS